MSRKIIVSCAITGSAHTPSMSPYLPVTAKRIAEEAIAAAEAGAAIVHLHARNEETGQPTSDPEAFMRFLPVIKDASDVVVNITTGGVLGMTIDERLAAPMRAQPELCSCNMGSMNFGLFAMLGREYEWQNPWEKELLENSRDTVFKNTFSDIDYIVRHMSDHGTRFEFECYDVSHLYTLAHFLDRGLVKPPLFVQTIYGILGGIGASHEDMLHMRRTADRLFGSDYCWSVFAAGRSQMPFATMGALMGSSVRVGLEDSLWKAKGELATSNTEQVKIIVDILRALSLETATPQEARDMLSLKGRDAVAF